MSWHIPPSGAELFCVLSSLELLGVGTPVFSFPLHQGVGRAAKQPALPAFSPSHPGKTGSPKFLRAVVSATSEGPVGSLGPAHGASSSSSTQAVPESRPVWEGRDPSGIGCCGSGLSSPMEPGSWAARSWVPLGAASKGPVSVPGVFNSRYAKTNTPVVL